MTTAGFLTSWTTNKAVYFTAGDASSNRSYGRIVPLDQGLSTNLITPYAKLGTASNYAGYIQPHQLKIYMVSNDAPGSTQKLNWQKQGTSQPELLLGGASGVDISDGHMWRTPFGVFVKFFGSNLYRINESGVLTQTITPQDLGGAGATPGSTNDYNSYPCEIGRHATDFAYISVGGQVNIYRPTAVPGAQPERITVTQGSPNISSYNANGLHYSHKYDAHYFCADTTVAGTQMFVMPYGFGPLRATSPVGPNNYANCITLMNGDPIFIGQDDKLYRSTDGGVNYSLFLNIDTLCDAFAFRYLATDGRNIFVNGISNAAGSSVMYQIDVNQAVRTWPSFGGYTEYDPNMLQCGHII